MMRLTTLLRHPPEWMRRAGPDSHIVLTSRVRLARNLSSRPFPGWSKKEDRMQSLEVIKPHIEALSEFSDGFSAELSELTKVQKQALVERHLISLELAAHSAGCAAVMDRSQYYCIMINEEDHLRLQGIRAGLDLEKTYEAINGIDTKLESTLDFAYDADYGYLTACPTNLGTGMRASAMLHLPALAITEKINQVMKAASRIGLAVRGLYGEGSEALGNLYQISNQHTLGEPEPKMIEQLNKVIRQIIEHEQGARTTLLVDKTDTLFDQIGRAYAILRHARILSSKEALNFLSLLRLAATMNFFPKIDCGFFDTMMLETQPAHLQLEAKRELQVKERDILRADTLRRKMALLPEPEFDHKSSN